MEMEKIAKSSQEQATASWINYLNQVRLDRLMESLSQEQENLDNAMSTISETLGIIRNDIVENGLGRGGEKGMHGFIAEVAECGIGNARSQIEGKLPIYEWINDNGPEDLKRGTTLIQQKFVNAGNHLSLQAIQAHLEHYPDFIKQGGVYQIPSDHFEKIQDLLSISEEEAYKMPTSTGEFSLRQWREVHVFFENGKIGIDDLEPSKLAYRQVQKNTYEDTLNLEKQNLQKQNQERRDQAYQESKPTLQQGVKVAAVSAALEGVTAFCIEVTKKRREGKHFRDFDANDWIEITGDTSVGLAKGGIRGTSVYLLTNYTATPAAVANAIVTASFEVANQAYLFRSGELDELAFIENSEMLCLDAAVSAMSSIAGQMIIPVPILGAMVGNAVGTILYQIAKDNLSAKEQRVIEGYLTEIANLDQELQEQYQAYLDEISKDLAIFMEILDRAFSPDVRMAFSGSIELVKQMGVPYEEILKTPEEIDAYFID